ncbi:cardiolipin synthase [Thalassolituus sp. LLYu03]|uniref:cardiolipin synthase n=1 Tax=Thalassolituus sp. LLYu03 TaxID=3421656 RepID=UPI003D2AC776
MAAFDWWILTLLIYGAGTLAALDALWQGRTAQGTIAWTLSLLVMPVIALPLYLFFGTRRLRGYRRARQHGDNRLSFIADEAQAALGQHCVSSNAVTRPFSNLFRLPALSGNDCRLLTCGNDVYDAMFSDIASARHYLCVQFYILRDDNTGQRLADLLCDKAREGVAVYLLYDEIGSRGIRRSFLQQLDASGVRVSRFNPLQLRNRAQLNFRNHRKLLICDGAIGYVGGYNLGDEYLGTPGQPWRDTQVRIEGPAALAFQLAFTEDWHWATGYVPQLGWQAGAARGPCQVMAIATGPADDTESASLYFSHLIHQAQTRCWLASPYFVPDHNLLSALQLAGLRGLDVRILLPERSDNWLVQQAMRSYIKPLRQCGVRFFTYSNGFLHQKVILIDDEWTSVGSANLDNRSLRINFEIGALIQDKSFARQTEIMLEQDFRQSQPTELSERFFPVLLAKAARLLAPVL